MRVGIFQLLSQYEGVSDQDVIAQALWEAEFADANGYDAVWFTEHHLSEYGFIGAPGLYAATLAARTRAIALGFGAAVAALHHPLRLAEEIAWLDNLAPGRLRVGLAPGFSAFEFGAYGVPLAERYERMEEVAEALRGLLAGGPFSYAGKHVRFPAVTLRPSLASFSPPPLLMVSSGEESLLRAARMGLPPLIGFRPNEQVAERIAAFRAARLALGAPERAVEREVGHIAVLRRVHVASSDDEAMADVIPPLRWYSETAARIHRPPGSGVLPKTPDELLATSEGGMIAGSPHTVRQKLEELAHLGVANVIAWMNFGSMPFSKVRSSMALLARAVLPAL